MLIHLETRLALLRAGYAQLPAVLASAGTAGTLAGRPARPPEPRAVAS